MRATSSGICGAASHVLTAGGGGYGGPPTTRRPTRTTTPGCRVTSLPHNLISAPGGLLYVIEMYTRHELITPFDEFGVDVPTTLYSVAYF